MNTQETTPTSISPEFRVLLAEDNRDWVELVTEVVEEAGGTLALAVSTLEEAMAAIVLLEKLNIDLVILGGSLGEFKEENEDAYTMLTALQERFAHIPSIGLSGHPDPIEGVTLDLGKAKASHLKTAIQQVLSPASNT